MRRLLEPCWWIFFLKITASVIHYVLCFPASTEGYVGSAHENRHGSSLQVRRRKAMGDPYWAYSGLYGPENWVISSVDCGGIHQSPIDITDHNAQVGDEYQELQLDGFDNESSNKTWMKNTGKTVAILLKDEYFISGAGLPGRFKAEKVEFHWGQSNGSAGSEHSINGKRYPVEMQIYFYNPDDFDSFSAALLGNRLIGALSVFFQVSQRDNPALDPIIHGLKGVVHHEKETFLDPFVLRDLLPASLGSYYRYTGSLTTPPCSQIVEWIVLNRPVPISYQQLEAFYSIFTTEQQDHVKSVEYLRNNFRPRQNLNGRAVFKSAVKDAWSQDFTDFFGNPLGTETSKVCSTPPVNMKVQPMNRTALLVTWNQPEFTYHPPIINYMISYSWTKNEEEKERTFVKDSDKELKAVINHVSPAVLYLFRVQAVCRNDMRSDFSQTMLFQANTTRIFEGTRIVKTGVNYLENELPVKDRVKKVKNRGRMSGSDADTTPTKGSEGTEEGEKDDKSEGEDGEREQDEEGEKDSEKSEKKTVANSTEGQNQTESTSSTVSPKRTMEEKGNGTETLEAQNDTSLAADNSSSDSWNIELEMVTLTQVPLSVTDEDYDAGQTPNTEETSRRPHREDDGSMNRSSSDNRFITINPDSSACCFPYASWPWSLEGHLLLSQMYHLSLLQLAATIQQLFSDSLLLPLYRLNETLHKDFPLLILLRPTS